MPVRTMKTSPMPKPASRNRRPLPVVIVTPDFVGPVRNGGVGTATFWQARALVAAGAEVEILFTGPMQVGHAREWAEFHWRESGVRFVDLASWFRDNDPATGALRFYPESAHQRTSYLVLQYLKRRSWAAIYFQDFCGHGFRTLQHKRAGLGFADTPCVVTLHSCHRWIREGMQTMPSSFPEVTLDFQEREAIRLADEIVAPSQYMAGWVSDRLGVSPGRVRVLPYCFMEEAPRPRTEVFEGFEELVFFGRLETRKGLHLFLDALRNGAALRGPIKRVTFLGKHSQVEGRASEEVIAATMKALPYEWQVVDNLDAIEVWRWLRGRERILVVAPSLSDNLPFTVIELFSRGVPFVSFATGGIPEIVGERNRHLLSAPTARGLREALERVVGTDRLTIDHRCGFDARASNRGMVRFHRSLRGAPTAPPAAVAPTQRAGRRRTPLVSVILPHFNSTAYLAMALDTLRKQTLREPFEVVVIDDKSSDPTERARFLAMAAEYDPRVFRFIESPENGGPSGARNYGSRFARGKYLVFFDADNEAEPHMLETMVRAIETAGADCLNCFNLHIPQADKAAPRWLEVANTTYIYAPLGPCLEAGFLQNVFGDACAICRRAVFRALNGFTNYRGSYEDWEFFARLVMRGYRHGVIPEVLFRYRDQSEGYSRSTSLFGNRMRVLQAYGSADGRKEVDWTTILAAITGVVDPTLGVVGGNSADEVYHVFGGMSEGNLLRYLGETADGAKQSTPYFNDMLAMRQRLVPLIAQWRARPPKIFIYGTGIHTRVLLGNLPELMPWVVGFIDREPKSSFLNRPCIVPADFRPEMAEVVIYSSKPAERQMYEALRRHAVRHVLIHSPETDSAPTTGLQPSHSR